MIINYYNLEESCRDAVHDLIVDAYNFHGKDFEDYKVAEIFNKLPLEVLEEGMQWGFDDTVAGDILYKYLKDNLMQLVK